MSTLVPFKKGYFKHLVLLMNFLHPDAGYTMDSEYPVELLARITPTDIVRYLRLKAYGNPDPDPNAHPVIGRANSSISYYKKALSYYMINKLTAWNEVTSQGNPTRSAVVNQLIKDIKRADVRKLGKKTVARRPLEPSEFEYTIALLASKGEADIKAAYMVTTAAKFQFHMMARLDDTCRFEESDLKPHPLFPFALLARMCWSKNVYEERDAPDQIILGCMDHRYCVLLALGIYLKTWLSTGVGNANNFLFGVSDNPERTKSLVYNTLKKVWESDGFVPQAEGPVGTHSLRKFPCTYARRNGCSKDDVDARGRWRRQRVSDVYVDINLPYPDAKAASTLCIGGPCKYALRVGSGISDQWLMENVVPCLSQRPQVQKRVSLVLALPILWACFDPRMENVVPQGLRTRIRDAYARVQVLGADVNPVKRVLLIVTGYENQVQIEEIVEIGEGGQAAAATADEPAGGNEEWRQEGRVVTIAGGAGANLDHFRALYAQNISMRRELQDVRSNLESLQLFMRRMNSNINRIGIQPARPIPRVRHDAAAVPEQRMDIDGEQEEILIDGRGVEFNITGAPLLSPTPRNLHILWQEFQFGIGGRKPAKLFTYEERGRCKYMYHRRKVVWDRIQAMIRAGHTSETAIDTIYERLGHEKSVTKIINELRRQRNRVF